MADATSDLEQLARDRAKGRTSVQAGIPAAALVVISWAAALAGVDLDPGPGSDLPAPVVAAIGYLATQAIAWLMNRTRPTKEQQP